METAESLKNILGFLALVREPSLPELVLWMERNVNGELRPGKLDEDKLGLFGIDCKENGKNLLLPLPVRPEDDLGLVLIENYRKAPLLESDLWNCLGERCHGVCRVSCCFPQG